jgi:hypothetical protein
MFSIFKNANPAYPGEPEKDFKPLLAIANFLNLQLRCTGPPGANTAKILTEWYDITSVITRDDFYCQKSLNTISNHIQEIFQKKGNEPSSKPIVVPKNGSAKSAGANELLAKLEQQLSAGG